jgi:hypothetical protein
VELIAELDSYKTGKNKLSRKGQTESMFSLAGNVVSVSNTHPHYCSPKADTYNTHKQIGTAVFQ